MEEKLSSCRYQGLQLAAGLCQQVAIVHDLSLAKAGGSSAGYEDDALQRAS